MNSLGRSVMSRRGSQENILQRDSSAKEISRSEKNYLNAVYDADYRDISDEESNQFMVEVNLGKKPRKAYQLPPEVSNEKYIKTSDLFTRSAHERGRKSNRRRQTPV